MEPLNLYILVQIKLFKEKKNDEQWILYRLALVSIGFDKVLMGFH